MAGELPNDREETLITCGGTNSPSNPLRREMLELDAQGLIEVFLRFSPSFQISSSSGGLITCSFQAMLPWSGKDAKLLLLKNEIVT